MGFLDAISPEPIAAPRISLLQPLPIPDKPPSEIAVLEAREHMLPIDMIDQEAIQKFATGLGVKRAQIKRRADQENGAVAGLGGGLWLLLFL